MRTALAPRARACSMRRSIAWLRVWTRVLVSPFSSPPTIDFRPAPIWLPRCRDRTVSPKTSPITRSTRNPGASLVVTTRMSAPCCWPPPNSSIPIAAACPGRWGNAPAATPPATIRRTRSGRDVHPLRSHHREQSQRLVRRRTGLGRVDDHVLVEVGQGEHVAVQGEGADHGVVEGLVQVTGAGHLAGGPQG